MIAPRASVHKVVAAMKAAHPYEEVAYDVYHLDNPNPNFGMGVIGELPKSQSLSKFLKSVKRSLGSKALRYTGNTTSQIKKVAVSSGSGSELLLDAINAKADVFITADIRYHTFHAAAESISLVDAGHWETEHVVLKSIANRIRLFAKAEHEPLLVFISEHSTNLIQIM
jgi:putative NIF3 family GTP cyclohydrolase 1 type 2